MIFLIFPIILIFTYFLVVIIIGYIQLKGFFFNLNKNDLFINGSKLDYQIDLRFGLLFHLHYYFPHFLPNDIRKILLTDQVSRHIYRNNQTMINTSSYLSLNLMESLTSQWESLSLKEKAFLSLATRHLCRISSSIEKGSVNHQLLSSLMDIQIELLRRSIDICQQIPFYSKNEIEFARLINSNNISVLRQHRFIPMQYQVWAHQHDDKIFTSKWARDFLQSEIAQYFIEKIDQLKKEHPSENYHFYLLISGGIDSMTMARICLGLQIIQKYDNVHFHGIHINWHKRNESTQEAKALSDFFQHFEQFDFQVIDCHIPPNDNDWERKTTDFRFDLLKKIQAENSPDMTIFCLGHIITDLIENLICNATFQGSNTGKQTYLDLFGMRELFNSGVWLFRPFLLHDKPNDITTPFLKDNATNLDIKRRIVRRMIVDLEYDSSRIRQLYQEFEENIEKYDNILITTQEINFNIQKRIINGSYYVITYDSSWTSLDWRLYLNTVMRNIHNVNIKKNSILEMLKNLPKSIKNPYYMVMSRPFVQDKGFILLPNNQLAIPIL